MAADNTDDLLERMVERRGIHSVVALGHRRFADDVAVALLVTGGNQHDVTAVKLFTVGIIAVDLVLVGTLGPYHADDG